MSVTNKTSNPELLVNSRNMPYGDRPPSRAIYNAEVCGICWGALEPQEPVWVAPWSSWWNDYTGRYIYGQVPRCTGCAPIIGRREVRPGLWVDRDGLEYWVERACGTCGRPTFKRRNSVRIHVFCCYACDRAYWDRRRRPKEQKVCKACGESFTATGRDAKTCSPACKQRAYRERKRSGS